MQKTTYHEESSASILSRIALEAARETIPVKVIARLIRWPVPAVRKRLDIAYAAGALSHMPPDEWPHLGGLSARLPCAALISLGHIDDDVADFAAEFNLSTALACVLVALVKRAGQVITKETILDCCAQDALKSDPGLATVQICKLRERLCAHGLGVGTAWGRGYIMDRLTADRIKRRITTRREAVFARISPETRPAISPEIRAEIRSKIRRLAA